MRVSMNCALCAFLLALMALVSPTVQGQPSAFRPVGDAPTGEPTSVPVSTEITDPVDGFITTQPLSARIAQMMLITLEGVTNPSVNDVAFFRAAMPGGVVMPHAFKPEAAAAYVNILREHEGRSGIPLLIGADLYQLTRPTRGAPMGFIQLPTLMSITAAGESEAAKRLGRLMAEQLRGMGFNLHLGPSLELAPTIGGALSSIHTFGSDPHFAADSGTAILEAFAGTGVLAMPMGFPGGGANRAARGAAVLTTPRTNLLAQDGLPYLEAIRSGVKILHVGNVLVPTLDMENRPASLSSDVVSGLLRLETGFTGVIVAGPMDDAALGARYESSEAAVQAVLAGADMLYWGGGLTPAMRAIERIARHVQEGHIAEERINDAVRRILTLKQELTIPEKATNEKGAAKLARQKELIEESLAIERRAITLVRNSNQVLPLSSAESAPVGITGVAGVEELYELLRKEIKPLVQQRITTARHLGEIQRFEIERLTRNISGLRTILCILTDDVRVETQVELIRGLRGTASQVVVIYLGNPIHAARLVEADALLLAYCEPVMLGQTISAMAEILLGKGPVSIMTAPTLRLRAGEERSFNALEVIRVPSGRLPIALSDQLPAGFAARYHPGDAIKRVEWDFAGKRVRRENAAHTFNEAGMYAVSLNVTDSNNQTHTQVFEVEVTE